MKSILITLSLIFIASFANAQESQIASLNKKYTTAIEQGDTNTLKEIFHDEMIVTGANGRQRDKKAEIADAVVPGLKVAFFKMDNENIHVFSNTAVTTGFLVWRVSSTNGDRDFKMVFTFTYAKSGKDWKIVAQHIARAPVTVNAN